MKINTHGGQDAFVYFMQKNPAFFELDKIIYPTGSLPNIWYLNRGIFFVTVLQILDAVAALRPKQYIVISVSDLKNF